MNKVLLGIGLLSLLLVNAVNAQELPTGEVIYNGIKYPAYVRDMNASVEQATAAVKEIFASRGVPAPKMAKGFLVYRNVVLPATGDEDLHDLFVKIDRIGKKTDNQSRIHLIITKPGAITDAKPLKGEKAAPVGFALAAGGEEVFTALQPAVENQVYLRSVLDQEAEVKKAEKNLRDLQDNKTRMEKQLSKLQADLEKNKKDIESAIKNVEMAKAELEQRKKNKPGN